MELKQSVAWVIVGAVMEHKISEAERLNKMRQDFVANVSHELRTPLTVIHGYVDTLLSLYTDHTELAPVFKNMQEQTQRMEALINDLLLLAKIENESPEAGYDPIQLTELVAMLKRQLENLAQNHTLSWKIAANFDFLGNGHELQSAFSNLITNAIRYTKPGGKIDVEAGVLKTGEAYFQVRDTGIGVAKEHIPRLTERFYRVDKGRSRTSGGTGLGLAIVKHVLLRHQAQLEVESELGQGSLFRCVFPKNRTLIK